jgi:hypothetical protein
MMPLVGDAGNMQTLRSFVLQSSAVMRRRAALHGERVAEELATGAGALARDVPDVLRPYAMMQAVDQLVSLPTWKAAYDTAMATKAGHDESVLRADAAVVDTIGGHDSKDKAAILEAGALAKALTTFSSYFIRTENLRRQAFRAAGADSLRGALTLPLRPAEAAQLGWTMSLLYLFPAAASIGGMMLLMPNDKRDREPLPGRITRDTLLRMAAGIPVVREISAGILGRAYHGPAGLRGLDTINRLMSELRQGKADRGAGRAALDTLGLLGGLPTTQAQRTLDGLLYGLDHGPDLRAPLFGPPR